MKGMEDYIDVATRQYREMRDEFLDEDRSCVGGENKMTHTINGDTVEILISGFWDRSDWFTWSVVDSSGERVANGTEYL